MLGRHPILGSFLFFLGLLLIAYNKEIGRQVEEAGRATRIWNTKNAEFIAGRIVSIVAGMILVLTGASLLLSRLRF